MTVTGTVTGTVTVTVTGTGHNDNFCIAKTNVFWTFAFFYHKELCVTGTVTVTVTGTVTGTKTRHKHRFQASLQWIVLHSAVARLFHIFHNFHITFLVNLYVDKSSPAVPSLHRKIETTFGTNSGVLRAPGLLNHITASFKITMGGAACLQYLIPQNTSCTARAG